MTIIVFIIIFFSKCTFLFYFSRFSRFRFVFAQHDKINYREIIKNHFYFRENIKLLKITKNRTGVGCGCPKTGGSVKEWVVFYTPGLGRTQLRELPGWPKPKKRWPKPGRTLALEAGADWRKKQTLMQIYTKIEPGQERSPRMRRASWMLSPLGAECPWA